MKRYAWIDIVLELYWLKVHILAMNFIANEDVRSIVQVIMAIVSTQKGRQAFISNRGIHFLCEINVSNINFLRCENHYYCQFLGEKENITQVKQTFQCEDALKLLLNILTIEGLCVKPL